MKKTIIATYSTLHDAETVVDELVEHNFARQDIGLAISKKVPGGSEASMQTEGPALVTVTADAAQMDVARHIIQRHRPDDIDERDLQWRKEGDTGDTPDEDDYTAIERK